MSPPDAARVSASVPNVAAVQSFNSLLTFRCGTSILTTVTSTVGRSPVTADPAARAAASDERPTIIEALRRITPDLATAIGNKAEAVLHDFAFLPNSIVSIGGADLTKRVIGGPTTDVLLRQLRATDPHNLINYSTVINDRPLRSSTLIVSDSNRTPIGALCLNVDISDWNTLRDLLETLTSITHPSSSNPAYDLHSPTTPLSEAFPQTVEELTSSMIDTAIAKTKIPVTLMKKPQKLDIVRDLDNRGIFLVRDAVETVADALGVTRFTIYNYLNELRGGHYGAHKQ